MNNKRGIFIILFLLKLGIVLGQEFNWVKLYEGNNGGTDYCKITTDRSGNIYSAGVFNGSIDFDPSANFNILNAVSGADNCFITKLDSGGNFVWARYINSNQSLRLSVPVFDNDGNLFFSGNYSGTLNFDTNFGLNSITSNSASESFLMKVNSSGQLIWIKLFGQNSSQTQISAITFDKNNALYLSGMFDYTFDADPNSGVFNLSPITIMSNGFDEFIMKLSTQGDFIWAKQLGGINGSVRSGAILFQENQNLCLTGRFNGSIDVDMMSSQVILTAPSTQSSIFVCTIDTLGNLIWVNTIEVSDTANISGYSIVSDSKSNVILSGFYYGKIDFNTGPDSIYYESKGTDNASFILKIGADGNFEWARNINNQSDSWVRTSSIDVDNEDNIYIAGGFKDSVDMDVSNTTNLIVSSNSVSNFILVLDKEGENKCLGYTVWENTTFLLGYNYPSISVNDFGNIYYASSILNTKDLDFTSNTQNVTSGGTSHKLYIEKMTSCIEFNTINQEEELVLGNVFTPNGDGINESFEIKLNKVKLLSFDIFNRWGVSIFKSASTQDIKSHVIHWDGYTTSGIKCSDGVYYYVLEIEDSKGKVERFKGYITLLR